MPILETEVFFFLRCQISPKCENKNKKGNFCRNILVFLKTIARFGARFIFCENISPHLDSAFSLVAVLKLV